MTAARSAPPLAAVVLGSGMSQAGGRVRTEHVVSFAEVPGVPPPTVAGHAGRIVLGDWSGRRVLLFLGRIHRYEGRSWDEVTAPVRFAAELGTRVLLCTNAAGGIRDDLVPGSLLAIQAHIEWTRPYCWQRQSPSPYSPRMLGLLRQLGGLSAGTYGAVTGPCYETPAEIRAMKAWGADAVGMSTAREVQAGRDLGMECAAVSLITNRAAGLSQGPIHHGEVLEHAAAGAARLADLIGAFLQAM
jgi:purine-nucleoside phosphorylase